ncbi:MAG: dienelactone hydrolase family protein [Planctomycetes bacterium]|nr:dienelactone hydrolase family protein [Planctomycetota bacterium]
MNLYTEPEDAGNEYRKEMLAQFNAMLSREHRKADSRRKRFFRPDFSSVQAYAESVEGYRRQFEAMLGWPLTLDDPPGRPKVRKKFVATDDLGRITRLWIETLPGLETYGLLFIPPADGPHPLIISQHGGGGTPEYCSSFFPCCNYNDMTRRVLKRGFAVFAPQLMIWADNFGPKCDHGKLDNQLKQIGGSYAALETLRLKRCLDYLTKRKDIDGERVGMIGLSWGSFHTLVAAAVDTRIKSAVASCFFNNRKVYDAAPATWFNSAGTFLDAEIASLVCPRRLCIEVGKIDNLFGARLARAEARKVREAYEKLGIAGEFLYNEHDGGHELDIRDDAIEFMCEALKA